MTLSLDKDWSYQDYLELPDDGNRYEVLKSRLHVTPVPSSYHQILSRRLQHMFFQLELEGKGQIFNAPIVRKTR